LMLASWVRLAVDVLLVLVILPSIDMLLVAWVRLDIVQLLADQVEVRIIVVVNFVLLDDAVVLTYLLLNEVSTFSREILLVNHAGTCLSNELKATVLVSSVLWWKLLNFLVLIINKLLLDDVFILAIVIFFFIIIIVFFVRIIIVLLVELGDILLPRRIILASLWCSQVMLVVVEGVVLPAIVFFVLVELVVRSYIYTAIMQTMLLVRGSVGHSSSLPSSGPLDGVSPLQLSLGHDALVGLAKHVT